MGFFNRVSAGINIQANRGQIATQEMEDSFLTRAFGGSKSSTGQLISQHKAMSLSAWFACVRVIAETVAHPPLEVYEKKGDSIDKAEDLDIYWALKNEFNDYTSSFVARETMINHLCGWGNAYMEVQRNGKGEPLKLWSLLPDRTIPELKNGQLRYLTSVGGVHMPIAPQNVIHVPGLSFDGLIGYSPIDLARNILGLLDATEEFGAKYFERGSRSGGVLVHPGQLSPKAKENIRQTHERDNAGLENAHRITILEEGMKFVPTTIPPNDAQFLETRKFQVIEVARFFRMPAHKIGEMENATYSNIEQQTIDFITDCIMPYILKIEHELNRKLWVTKEMKKRFYVKFNLKNLLRGDSKQRAEFYGALLDRGAITRNEVRGWEELQPIPGLDKPLVPLNYQEAGSENEQQTAVVPAPARRQREVPDERALQVLEAARLVGRGEPGAEILLDNLVRSRYGN